MMRIEGFIDVEKMLNEIGVTEEDIDNKNALNNSSIIKLFHGPNNELLLNFNYNNENYFYKYNLKCIPYNELVANELAKDFGLQCSEYDLAVLGLRKGVISKDFRKDNMKYISAEEILKSYWNDNIFVEEHNNLEDIWDSLEYRYQNNPNKRKIIKDLMNKIVSIFIFDIIICNYDRHSLNWGIMENSDTVDIAPLYDNERILLSKCEDAFVSLTMENIFRGNLLNNLKLFNKVSEESFINLLKNKTWIISEENLKLVLKKVEDKISYPLPESIKNYYSSEYDNHRKSLEKVLKYYN